MEKLILLSCSVWLLWSCQSNAQQNSDTNTTEKNKKMDTAINIETIYQFKVKDLYGEVFDFASLKGKKILIVN